MRAVNLLPADERRKGLDSSARTPLLGAAAGIALVALLATVLASLAAVEASDKHAEIDAVEAAIAALPEPPPSRLDPTVLVQERTDRESALASALSRRVAFDKLLRQVALVLPGDAWLTQLDAAVPVVAEATGAGAPPPSAAAAATKGVTIQGGTWTHDNVAVVLARLASIPTLADVSLTSTSRVGGRSDGGGESSAAKSAPNKPYVTFVISANLNTGDVS
jgi:Tfp pilus assembly protein PilN